MITLKADQLSEQALAEIALAVRNRWNVPTFVKMHEVIILDDDEEDQQNEVQANPRVLSTPISSADLEIGLNTVLRNLELDGAFRLERNGKMKFKLKLIDPDRMPKWLEKANQDLSQPPEGMYACQHCGAWFPSDFELSLHTKLHYIL